MLIFVGATLLSFILWLLLTFNGRIWGADEIVAGIIFSIISGVITQKVAIKEYKSLSPKKWLYLIGCF